MIYSAVSVIIVSEEPCDLSEEACVVKKLSAFLLSLLLLLCFTAARAQSFPCAAAGIVLDLPDSFTERPVSPGDDPDLVLKLRGRGMTVLGYVSYIGNMEADAYLFQLFTGDETDSGEVVRGGVRMLYAMGVDSNGAYVMYTWIDPADSRKNVTLYFYYSENDPSSLTVAEEAMDSLVFGEY